jgi:thiamine monophosphate synthase
VSELLAITDLRVCDPRQKAAALAAALGPRLIILVRDRELERADRRTLCVDLLERVAGTGARVRVSDDLDLAAELGLGVQLSERGPSVAAARAALGGATVGVSRHDRAGLLASKADCATLSPVLASPRKGRPMGWEAFRLAIDGALPTLALGGIGPAEVEAAVRAGAAGVAAIRAAWTIEPAAWAAAFSGSRG